MVGAVTSIQPNFLSSQNVLNVLQQNAPVGIMAMAGTFVMIAGGFDLSVGGTFVLAGTMYAGLANSTSVGLAFVVVLALGLAIGWANGLIVTKARVNPLIATIGTGQMLSGLALIYSAAPIIASSTAFTDLGQNHLGPVPASGVLVIALFLLGGLVLSRTVYGRTIYAVGGNPLASRLSGLRVDRITAGTYAISGTAAALAGIVYASRLGIGEADVEPTIAFTVIIAIVLGGTAVGGGSGSMWRTAVGVAILAVLQNGLDTLNISSTYEQVITGAILVTVVAWDMWSRTHRGRVGAGTRHGAPTAETTSQGDGVATAEEAVG
jgi:ribose transport system permease protein